jgi:MoaA/NifB/PqqE/SkfB family radical SAM enzyme
MVPLVDDFVARGYFGIILTGGEPTLHEELPKIARYARDSGLHVRMITNGWRLSDEDFARRLADAGLQHVHISVYSVRPEVEAVLRGIPNTLPRAFEAARNANKFGMDVDVNCVITKMNADHLDENIEYWIKEHPYIRHFIWNNLDPSMGRAEVNVSQFQHRLADCEVSLRRSMSLLHASGRTFRVEKMPLCYMAEFGWASTETRKIVKGEERIVHFLDNKQTVRQTSWGHLYSDTCGDCSLRTICGGVFDRGGGYDPAELYPVFMDRDVIVEKIINDPSDPSFAGLSLDQWRADFDLRIQEQLNQDARRMAEGVQDEPQSEDTGMAVGQVSDASKKKWKRKRKAETRLAERQGLEMELPEVSET